MKKIVILGCENSHANNFLDFITKKTAFSHIEVVGVYSEDTEAAEKLNEKYGVPVMASFDEAVGKVDGVIITARHGGKHYQFAKPYLGSGIPLFIDKPITVSEEEAVAFMRELKKTNTPVSGGSMLVHNLAVRQLRQAHEESWGGPTIGGIFRAPLLPSSPHGGYFFYAQHLVQMVTEAFGRYPKAVRCYTDENQNRTVLFCYEDFTATGFYANGGTEYFAARFSQGGTQGGHVNLSVNDSALAELWEFVKLLEGGKMPMSYQDFISPVHIMNAIERANESGALEPVRYAEV